VAGPRRRGVGMAIGQHGSAAAPRFPTSATVQVNHDGTVLILAGAMDQGTGCKTTLAQVCAETMGLKMKDVYTVKTVDTEVVHYSVASGGSKTLPLGGAAVMVAARDARRQILEMAATAPWSPDILKEGASGPDDLDIKDGLIYVKADPDRCAAVKEVVSSVLAPIVIGKAHRHNLAISGPTACIPVLGFADVEVDTETGRVTVLKIVAGQDSGRIVNPQVCENQVLGGALMSLGYGLMEEVVLDPATGRVLNPALTDYRMPTAMDMPSMVAIFADNIDPTGPFGAKGIGEASNISPHAAIASAIYNAIGVRINEVPITPEKILNALRALHNHSR
ncbi:xanthine dehydrogenase family protein molybdopterin-binding subunit, partial [Chloroflexota bacterium]